MSRLALCLGMLLVLCWTGSVGAVHRDAVFKRGVLRTDRGIMVHQRHLLASSQQQDNPPQIWVLGLGHAAKQKEVHGSLKAHAGQFLHVVPAPDAEQGQLHWLVKADAAAVQAVLAAHADVTAAPMPADFKLSDAVVKWQDTTASCTTTLGEPRGAHSTPADLQLYVRQQGHHRGGARQGAGSTAVVVKLLALTPQLSANQLSSLQARLRKQLAQLVQPHGSQCSQHSVQSVVARAIQVTVCPQAVCAAARLLAAQADVTWVDLEPKWQLHDLYAIGTTQDPANYTTNYPAPNIMGGLGNAASAAHYPYWQAGLDGTGQIVGVVDSGLDMDSCFVWDPQFVDYQKGSSTKYYPPASDDDLAIPSNVTIFANAAHRKVVMYAAGADFVEGTLGHGTHVITSIVGAAYGNDNPMQKPQFAIGQAPGAKVAFYDVGSGGEDTLVGLNADTSAFHMYYTLQSAGARVMSNSWGSNEPDYTATWCAILDDMLFHDSSVLQVFAAGNSGSDTRDLTTTGTVSSPGTCKNVLTVGATQNWVYDGVMDVPFPLGAPGQTQPLAAQRFFGLNDYGTVNITVLEGGTGQGVRYSLPTTPTRPRFLLLPGYFSGVLPLANKSLPVVIASPLDACSPLDTSIFPSDGTPAMVLFSRQTSSSCTLSQAAHNVLDLPQAAGALMYYEGGDDSIDPANVTITASPQINGKPGVQIPYTVGDNLVAAVQQAGGSQPSITVTWAPPVSNSTPPQENVAVFSSYGSRAAFGSRPSSKYYRIKPDLTAPGLILAGHSDGQYSGAMDQCDVFTIEGTSMATPQVSGAALLVRQYFMTGFYPTGAATQAHTYEPSGVLVKALLVAGTTPMVGLSLAAGTALQPPPSPFQGFGRVDLSNTLLLANAQVGWNLQVIDQAVFQDQGETHTYAFSVAEGGAPLSVAMVFYDAAAYPGARVSTVNNLDLTLQGPAGTYYPNGLSQADPVNTVEKIYVLQAPGGNYTATITAAYLSPRTDSPATPQNYSLVVLGGVTTPIDSPYNPARGVALKQPDIRPPRTPPGTGGGSVPGAAPAALLPSMYLHLLTLLAALALLGQGV